MTQSFLPGRKPNITNYAVPPSGNFKAPGSEFSYGSSANGQAPSGIQLWNLNDGPGAGNDECDVPAPYWNFQVTGQPISDTTEYYRAGLNYFCFNIYVRGSSTFNGTATFNSTSFMPTEAISIDGQIFEPLRLITTDIDPDLDPTDDNYYNRSCHLVLAHRNPACDPLLRGQNFLDPSRQKRRGLLDGLSLDAGGY